MNKDQFERVALGIIIASLLYVPTQLCNGSRCVSAGWNFIFTTEYSVDFIKLLIEEIIIGLLLFYLWRNKSKIKSKKPSIKSKFWPDVWKGTKKVWYGFTIVFAGRLGFMLGLAIQGIILGLISAGIAAYFMSSFIRFIAIKFYKSDIHSTYFEEGKLFTSTKKFFWIVVGVCIALPFITNYDDFKNINSESRAWFNNLNISNPLSAIDTSTFVKNVSLGDTKKDVLNKLGYPLSIRVGNDILTGEDAEVYIDDLTHQDMDTWKYMFANHFITINSNPYTKYITGLEHDYVSEVRCEHREGKFVDPDDTYCPYLGIDLFTKQEKVINQLGNPDGNLFKSIADKQFYYSKLGVTLTIKDNQVVAIGLHRILKK